MIYLLKILSIFWFIGTLKFILFWVYLWQLKEYHLGRFKDHFRTYKGKKIFFNWLFGFKLLIFILLLLSYNFFDIAFYALLLVYLLESLNSVTSFLRGRLKMPVFTPKTTLLTFVSCLLFIGLFFTVYNNTLTDFWFLFSILVFDILTSLIVSAVVLTF